MSSQSIHWQSDEQLWSCMSRDHESIDVIELDTYDISTFCWFTLKLCETLFPITMTQLAVKTVWCPGGYIHNQQNVSVSSTTFHPYCFAHACHMPNLLWVSPHGCSNFSHMIRISITIRMGNVWEISPFYNLSVCWDAPDIHLTNYIIMIRLH